MANAEPQESSARQDGGSWPDRPEGFARHRGDSYSVRPDFPPVTADPIVLTFTRNVRVGQPPRPLAILQLRAYRSVFWVAEDRRIQWTARSERNAKS
jgi:hypothetical protein